MYKGNYPLAFLALLLLGVASAQTPPPCGENEPKCYFDLAVYNGYGPAANLPSSLCSTCGGDSRRVIVLRIDSSWGSPTNASIWNAVQCAVAAWNGATDSANPPNRTGYYFVLDQGNATGVWPADITIKQGDPGGGDLAGIDVSQGIR
jgi:hypothetical protein